MELYMICVLTVVALSLLIYKGILFAFYLAYPLPGEDLKWRRAPTLPMQDLSRTFGSKSSKGSKGKKGKEKQPLARAEMPLESVRTKPPMRPPSVDSQRGPGTDV